MSTAAARSKSVRLALALAAVLIALGALVWWIGDAVDTTADVAVASTVGPTEASAIELDPTAVESVSVPAVSTRKPQEAAPVVDSTTQAIPEWGRLHVTVRSSAPHVRVTKGTASLSPRVLRNRKQGTDLDLSANLSGNAGAIRGDLDANGQVEFDRVPLGDWVLVVQAEGFDRAEQSVTLESEAVMNLEITAEPLVLAELAVVLRHPNGIPLFDALSGPDLEAAEALRPAFVEQCPAIGGLLPASARPLIHRARYVRKEHPDKWMQVTFKKPVAGCACVLLGELVLDAVPFQAGQETVVLSVDPAALAVPRCALEIVVTDELTSAPLVGAEVRVIVADGRTLTFATDSTGRLRADGFLPGEVRLQVKSADHALAERRVTLSAGTPTQREAFTLAPRFWIRGSMTFPASGPAPYGVSAYSTDVIDPKANQSAFRPESVRLGNFEIGPLVPGEYLVGIPLPNVDRPLVGQVRQGLVDGWCIVNLRRGSVEGLTIHMTEALAARMRAELEKLKETRATR